MHSKENKSDNTESESHTRQKWSCNSGNVDTAAIWKTRDVEPEELGEGKLIDTDEECSCDKKNRNVLEEVMLSKIFTFRVLWEIVSDTESVKGK